VLVDLPVAGGLEFGVSSNPSHSVIL